MLEYLNDMLGFHTKIETIIPIIPTSQLVDTTEAYQYNVINEISKTDESESTV